MNNKTKLKLLIALFIVMSFGLLAQAQNPGTLKSCEDFKSKVLKEGLVQTGKIKVPMLYNSKKIFKSEMSVFYWVKKGTDSTKVPILLIHGGPGGNSWRYYEAFKKQSYAGDIISIDNRNEGCSHVKDYNLSPVDTDYIKATSAAYEPFRNRNIVRDVEALRKKLYPDQPKRKWRVFGQSRGAAIAHMYLEMFPESLESIQTQGFVMLEERNIERYTYMRSRYNANGSNEFELKFPEAALVLKKAKNYFQEQKICLPMNLDMMNLPVEQRPTVCGALITDSISYKLSNYSRWGDISNSLLALKTADGELDTQKTLANFQNEINGNIYVQYMNYIMGTNGQDVGSPAPRNFDEVLSDGFITGALISEGRFVASAVYPAYLKMGYPSMKGSGDQLDFAKVKKFLVGYRSKYGKNFEFYLFSSIFDTIAGPEMYNYETKIFGNLVQFKILKNSGHEAWQTEPELQSILFR